MRTLARAFLPCLLLTACDDAITSGDAQNVIETVSVEVHAFVVGDVSSSKADAEASWNRECTAWAKQAADLAGGAKSSGFDCGKPKNLHTGSWFLFGSDARLGLSVGVDEEGELLESVAGRVSGDASGDQQKAIASWRDTCSAKAATVGAHYGDGFVSSSCGEPKNVHTGSWFRFESEHTVMAAARPGVDVELPGYVVGGESQELHTSTLSWQTACDDWLGALGGNGQLVGHSCGEPKNLHPGSWFQLGAATTVRMRAELEEGQHTSASRDDSVTGDAFDSRAEAFASWRERCNEETAYLREAYGDHFLVASCGEPKNVHPGNWFRFRSSLELRVAASSGTEIEVPGYALGPAGPDAPAAENGWRAACHAWLDATADIAGVDRLAGHSCGEPKNLHTGSWFFYGAPTVLRIVVALPEGTEPTVKSAGKATGMAQSESAAAVSSWQQACSTAIAAQRKVVGDGLLAASCGEPKNVHTGSWFQYESPVTLWVEP